MLKHIRIFGIVLLVAILALPLDAFACDDLKTKRDEAQTALDTANQELRNLVGSSLTLIGTLTLVPPPSEPGEPPPDDQSSGLAAGIIAKGLDPDVEAAITKRNNARTARDKAQTAVDICEGHETRSCGCSVSKTQGVTSCSCDHKIWNGFCSCGGTEKKASLRPCGHPQSASGDHSLQASCTTDVHCIATNFYLCLHTSHEYAQDCTHTPKCGKRIHPCGCEDYTCLFPGHAIRDCPLSPSGTRCTVFYWGYYWTCNPHEHVYPGEPTDPKPALPSRQPCQHFYVTGSSEADNHQSVTCPTRNGQACIYGSYYICRGEHIHAYPAPTQQTQTTQKKTITSTTGNPPTNNNNGNSNGGNSNNGNSNSRNSQNSGNSNNNGNSNNGNSNNGNNNGNSQDDDDDDDENTPNAPTNPPITVTYHPCSVHTTSESGDHSLQASCSRDSRCIASNFYYCQHSSHTYAPEPPSPPPVRCPANSWTNCGGTSSHATTCGAGHTYYTCNPSAVSSHSGHSSGCPASQWTGCGSSSSHATTCGRGHTYYTCNPSAVSAHSGHQAIVCPANRWTSCGGTTSHATTCGRGHTYYTCNPNAVQAHNWH